MLQSQGPLVGFTVPIVPTGHSANSIMNPSQNPTYNSLDFQSAMQDGAITSISLQYLSANVIKGGTISGVSLTIGQNFSVSQSGQMTATGALIGDGVISGGTINIGAGNFVVNSDGSIDISNPASVQHVMNLRHSSAMIVFDETDTQVGMFYGFGGELWLESGDTIGSPVPIEINSKTIFIGSGIPVVGAAVTFTSPITGYGGFLQVIDSVVLQNGNLTLTSGDIDMAGGNLNMTGNVDLTGSLVFDNNTAYGIDFSGAATISGMHLTALGSHTLSTALWGPVYAGVNTYYIPLYN